MCHEYEGGTLYVLTSIVTRDDNPEDALYLFNYPSSKSAVKECKE